MWPWCIFSSISFLMDGGITILSPLRIAPFSSDSSSRTSQYAWILAGVWAFVAGHPDLIISESSSLIGPQLLLVWFLPIWILWLVGCGLAGGHAEQSRLPCCRPLFERLVLGKACQGTSSLPGLYSKAFAFSEEFFVISVVLQLAGAFSLLLLQACDLILWILSSHRCIGGIARG